MLSRVPPVWLVVFGILSVQLGRNRPDLLPGPGVHRVTQHPVRVVKLEVHAALLPGGRS